MKPIVLLFTNNGSIIVTAKDGHDSTSWAKIPKLLTDLCVADIDKNGVFAVSSILDEIRNRKDLNCDAVEGLCIPTWVLVE